MSDVKTVLDNINDENEATAFTERLVLLQESGYFATDIYKFRMNILLKTHKTLQPANPTNILFEKLCKRSKDIVEQIEELRAANPNVFDVREEPTDLYDMYRDLENSHAVKETMSWLEGQLEEITRVITMITEVQ